MADTFKTIGPVALGTTDATIYTVPPATEAIIRWIGICNNTPGTLEATYGFGADASGTRLASSVEVPGKGILRDRLTVRLAANGQFRAHGNGSGLTLTMTVVERT